MYRARDNQARPSRQLGFGLVELMVALALSLLLLGGVVAIFISSRQSYETTERLSRVQEIGRFALEQIVDDLRAAGYVGCARPPTSVPSRAADYLINELVNETHPFRNFAVPIEGFDTDGSGTWTPALPSEISALSPSGVADVLVVRGPERDALALRLTERQTSGSDVLEVDAVSPAPLDPGDIAVISDCAARAWFQVDDYTGGQITHAAGLNEDDDFIHPFALGAEIVPVNTVVYYLDAPNAGKPTSLYRLVVRDGNNGTPEPLAEGIERFEVQYGVDSVGGDGRVDQYVDASAVTDWSSVISVRIALLARSMDAYGTDLDSRTYVLLDPDAPVGPFNDRFQRQVFTTTVALRNQVID